MEEFPGLQLLSKRVLKFSVGFIWNWLKRDSIICKNSGCGNAGKYVRIEDYQLNNHDLGFNFTFWANNLQNNDTADDSEKRQNRTIHDQNRRL